jgi:7,8-dihydroneopterin aldolase/epimerase/oxygenase
LIGEIYLEGIEIIAFHGVYEQERKLGNTFLIDLKIKTDIEKSAISDNLNDTVDYAVLYNIIKTEMEIPSKLIENVVTRIVNKISNQFSEILEIDIKIAKNNPPIDGKAKNSAVRVVWIR